MAGNCDNIIKFLITKSPYIYEFLGQKEHTLKFSWNELINQFINNIIKFNYINI